MRLSPLLLAATGLALLAAPLTAQDPALVEALAPLLMAEDRRQLDLTAMARAIGHPDPLVRRTAVVAVGRIGDRRGAPLIVEALGDRDQNVVADAFFALGLLTDSNNAAAIIARLRQPDSLDAAAAGEASAALARSGGSAAVAMLTEIIGGRTSLPAARRDLMLPTALLESWKLAAQAPVAAMLPFLTNPNDDLRWRATYTLARLKAPTAGNGLLRSARDKMALIREAALRSYTKAYADSAGLPAATVLGELRRALQDASPGVKISALQALGSWRDSAEVTGVLRLLTDADFNVRVQATTALGELRGEAAMAALDGLFDKQGASWAMRRVAFSALARADTTRFAKRAAVWQASQDVRERMAAYEGWGSISSTGNAVFQAGLQDADARVQAAALGAWRSARPRTDSTVVAAARERLRSAAPEVRATAAGVLGANARVEDLDLLLAAWRLGAADVERDAQQAVLAKENPHVTVELDGRGTIDLELLGREAPLTVANFLRLVDRRWFDGNRWHRVVPNFVIQDGDRSGTGSGGPGWAIRDEFNRRRYDVPMAGMALSGPETGGSQWFINVSPQPHLDGRYTIFGKVAGSYAALLRVTQGDVIRSIHR